MADVIDEHLDKILRAAGSGLRHYTMQKTRDDMRAALASAVFALAPTTAAPPINIDVAVDGFMTLAQEFASAWSLVGGPFDSGSALQDAQDAKGLLRAQVWALATRAAKTSFPAWLDYNHERDELLIHGKRYAAAMFAAGGLAGPHGMVLQLVEAGVDRVAFRHWHSDALVTVLDELRRATEKFPTWPDDALHALAILGEEFGELTKAMLQKTYEPHKVTDDEIFTEAVQTAAMALRLVMSLTRYRYDRSEQHSQGAAA